VKVGGGGSVWKKKKKKEEKVEKKNARWPRLKHGDKESGFESVTNALF
jgi:hypothetical protein